ncbi:hypothetical protein MKW98_007236, partial [Papaver atlanticum]
PAGNKCLIISLSAGLVQICRDEDLNSNHCFRCPSISYFRCIDCLKMKVFISEREKHQQRIELTNKPASEIRVADEDKAPYVS